jgi:hypothetical protein
MNGRLEQLVGEAVDRELGRLVNDLLEASSTSVCITCIRICRGPSAAT